MFRNVFHDYDQDGDMDMDYYTSCKPDTKTPNRIDSHFVKKEQQRTEDDK